MSYECDVEVDGGVIRVTVVDHEDVSFTLHVPRDKEDDIVFQWLVNNMDDIAIQAVRTVLERGN